MSRSSFSSTKKTYNFRKTTLKPTLYSLTTFCKRPQPPRGIFEICGAFEPTYSNDELRNYKNLEREGLFFYTKISMPYTMHYVEQNITDICVSASIYGQNGVQVVLFSDLLQIPSFSKWVKDKLLKPPTQYKAIADEISSIMIKPKLVSPKIHFEYL